MAASKATIRRWFLHGINNGNSYMIIFNDRFTGDDYPMYTNSTELTRQIKESPADMQDIMEIYDLCEDMETQLAQDFTMAI